MLILPCLASPGQWDRPPVAIRAMRFWFLLQDLPRNSPKAKQRFAVGMGGVKALMITGTTGTAMLGFKKCSGKKVAWSNKSSSEKSRIEAAIEAGVDQFRRKASHRRGRALWEFAAILQSARRSGRRGRCKRSACC